MSNLKILLVDDNLGDQLLVEKALAVSNKGTKLHVVSDGEEAMDYLSRKGTYHDAWKPDLVILDLNVPKKSGKQVLEEVRREPNLEKIPVVLVTGARATPELSTICKFNPNFYAVKPDRVEAFFFIVRAIEEYGEKMVAAPNAEKEHAEELRERIAA